jgi:hypothetical protein
MRRCSNGRAINRLTMNDQQPYLPYLYLAGICGAASVAIVLVALKSLNQISDVGMCAIAGMAAAPAVMGIGISYFMCLTLHHKGWAFSNATVSQLAVAGKMPGN